MTTLLPAATAGVLILKAGAVAAMSEYFIKLRLLIMLCPPSAALFPPLHCRQGKR
ncbi:hypothetical protein [Bradyrhizobium lablabi]|uniref:hypothetical protein n=1 Tax=Bradyrhizobium lablabi TaxID=722472 RepID=UPI00201280FC|nr:hypothetical protein [Bradyrhizobium lablabi]